MASELEASVSMKLVQDDGSQEVVTQLPIQRMLADVAGQHFDDRQLNVSDVFSSIKSPDIAVQGYSFFENLEPSTGQKIRISPDSNFVERAIEMRPGEFSFFKIAANGQLPFAETDSIAAGFPQLRKIIIEA